MLYLAYEAQRSGAAARRDSLAGHDQDRAGHPPRRRTAETTPDEDTLDAACQMLDAGAADPRPSRPSAIDSVQDRRHRRTTVVEEEVQRTAFGSLLHFRKVGAPAGPRVLHRRQRSPATSRRCSGTPPPPCCPTTTFTSPTGSTPVTCRSMPGRFGLDDYVGQVVDQLELTRPGHASTRRVPAMPGGPGSRRRSWRPAEATASRAA